MSYKTKYVCTTCHLNYEWLPERPLRPTPRIRTGCDECERLTPHAPVGSVHA